MSTAANEAVFQRAVNNWNDGNLTAYLDLYDAQVILHGLPPGLPPGREGVKLFYDGLWEAFPQPRLIIQDVIMADDRLACRFQMEGNHQGAFMGIPPTGKSIQVSGMTILRFVGGKCVERWNQTDMLGWLQQLGAIPAS